MSEEVKAEIVPAAPAAKASANWVIPKDLKAMKLFNETKSFVVVRALVYAVITAAMFIGGIVAIGLCALTLWLAAKSGGEGASVIGWWFGVVIIVGTLGTFFAFLRFAKVTVLYFVKAAHIAAITEYLRTGAVPVTEKGYKGVLAFGKEKVAKNLGATAVAFVADKLIAGATRQIMRWVNKAQKLFSFIPGSEKLFSVINFILSTALNFIDEAVLSYIFYHVEEKNPWKKACDGLVYYAQAWKGMLMGATKVAAFVWVLRAVSFIIFFSIFAGMAAILPIPFLKAFTVVIGVIFGSVFSYGLMTIVVEPFATCMMIKEYHIAIAGKPLAFDMFDKVSKVSKSFKELFNKSKDPSLIPAGESESAVAATAEVSAQLR